jgi:hypothetical protein
LPVDPGISKVPIPATAARPADITGSPIRWERADELPQYRPVGTRFVSRGHFAGRWKVQIAVNALAEPTYADLGPTSRFAVGSVLVKSHFDAETGAPGPVFARIKRDPGFFPEGDDWEYIATDAAFSIEERGQLAVCARCHSEGIGDDTFVLPPEAR